MGDWLTRADPGDEGMFDGLIRAVPECGTIGCIAGMIDWCAGTYGNGYSSYENAATALGFKPYSTGCGYLFHVSDWKEEFKQRWDETERVYNPAPEAIKALLVVRAQIVADVIDDFIAETESSDTLGGVLA